MENLPTFHSSKPIDVISIALFRIGDESIFTEKILKKTEMGIGDGGIRSTFYLVLDRRWVVTLRQDSTCGEKSSSRPSRSRLHNTVSLLQLSKHNINISKHFPVIPTTALIINVFRSNTSLN